MTAPQPAIWPTFTYDGDIPHAELRWPEGGGVMVSSAKHCRGIINPGVGSAYVVTDHVDDIHDRCVTAGAVIIQPLEDTDYGSHTFGVRDPEGNAWFFGTYRGT